VTDSSSVLELAVTSLPLFGRPKGTLTTLTVTVLLSVGEETLT